MSYPHCDTCDKRANPAHLASKAHKEATMTQTDNGPIEDPTEELRALLAEAEERALKAEAEAEHWKPYKAVPVYNTPEEAKAVWGANRLRNVAEAEVAKENKRRIRSGLPGINYTDPELYEGLVTQEIDKIARELVRERTKWVSSTGAGLRTMKMVKPVFGSDACTPDCSDRGCYEHGHLIQIPVEEQINNQRAAPGQGIGRYKEKGYKLAEPYLCELKDCYTPAFVEGNAVRDGCCTPEHSSRLDNSRGPGHENRALTVAGRMM